MRVDENGCDWKDIFGWIGVAVVLVALTALSVCTLGAAAPISGIAATMVVGGQQLALLLGREQALYPKEYIMDGIILVVFKYSVNV